MEVSRALVAFAYVSEAFEQTGDIAVGLVELFAPLLAEDRGKRFDPERFVDRVKDVLDIEMHPYAAETLIPRLAERGYLTERAHTGDFVEYVVADIKIEDPAIAEADVAELLDSFDQFVKRHAYGTEDLKENNLSLHDELLNRLMRPEFLDLIRKPDESDPRQPILRLKTPESEAHEEKSLAARLDVLVASFILEVRNAEPEMFDLVSDISGGALLAEVVLNTQTPTDATKGISDVTIFIDGPLVMDALGMNTVGHSREYASRLFDQLRDAGATLSVFEHTVEEIRNAINTPLERFVARQEVSGPLGELLYRDSNMVSYVRGVLASLRDEIQRIGIGMFQNFPLTERQLAAFSVANEDELADRIGHRNVEARQRDAKSVANVLRLRGTLHCTDLSRCRYLFVTRNSVVSNASRGFLKRYKLAPDDYFAPTVTDRYLAGLIWVAFGGGGKELSRLKLISNCSATMRPRQDVVANMHRFLSKVDDGKVEKFKAIMTDQRAGHFLMDLTLGDAAIVREDNVEELYESIRKVIAHEVAEQKEGEIAELRNQHSEDLVVLRRAHGETEDALLHERSKLKEAEQGLSDMQAHRQLDAEAREQRETQQLVVCVQKGANRTRVLEVVVASMIALAAGGAAFVAGNGLWALIGAILAGGACLANYLLFPGKLLDSWLRTEGEKVAAREAENLGLSLEKYEVDWHARSVVRLERRER